MNVYIHFLSPTVQSHGHMARFLFCLKSEAFMGAFYPTNKLSLQKDSFKTIT